MICRYLSVSIVYRFWSCFCLIRSKCFSLCDVGHVSEMNTWNVEAVLIAKCSEHHVCGSFYVSLLNMTSQHVMFYRQYLPWAVSHYINYWPNISTLSSLLNVGAIYHRGVLKVGAIYHRGVLKVRAIYQRCIKSRGYIS